MTSSDAGQFGRAEADRLLELGWAQAQVAAPDSNLPAISEGAVFVVCTQTCSVVSDSLQKDPWIELAEARPLKTHNPKSDHASGNNVRKYHLPIEEAEFQALEVDINRRCFVDRRLFLDLAPVQWSITQKARRDFAGWLGRYYSRLDLPNELTFRLKTYLRPAFEKFLKGTPDGDSERRHTRIGSIFVSYSPDEEIGADKNYSISFLLLCNVENIAQKFDEELIDVFGGREIDSGIVVNLKGLSVKLSVRSIQETLLIDLHDYHRFTDWDHLSGPWEALANSKV